MKSRTTALRATTQIMVCSLVITSVLSGCAAEQPKTLPVSGGISALFPVDSLSKQTALSPVVRNAAPLGLFVAEYLSTIPAANATQAGLQGIQAQYEIIKKQQTISDPDFELIQAFADALQVDVPDLLNRSMDRQAALDAYSQSLTNVATRSNERYKELSTYLDELTATSRTQSKERTIAERDLAKAMSNKDFSSAGELQKTVLEKQQAFADTDLKRQQTDDMVTTFDRLLTLFGQKILAIQQNREILIAGNKVVNVPGIEELKILEKGSASSRKSGDSGKFFEGLF